MTRYIILRIVNVVVTLLVIATLTFFLMKLLPGSPLNEEKLVTLPAEVQAQIYAKYDLDKPVVVQYFSYMANLAHGDLGNSFYYKGQSVTSLLAPRIGPSLIIGVQAIAGGAIIGALLGLVAAVRRNKLADHAAMILSVLGIAIPNFVFAALIQYWLGYKWALLPIAYWESYRSSILPTAALSLAVIALVARFIRTQMVEVLQSNYIKLATAKGLSSYKIVMIHGLRNALIPALTVVGTAAAGLITGSLVIETIFSVPGIGSLFVESIKLNDYPMIMGVTLLYSAMFVLIVLVVDVLYSVIDPRIRIAGTKDR